MELQKFITETLKTAGEATLPFYKKSTITRKGAGSNDIFTEADLASQHVIIDAIKRDFPNDGIVAEEAGCLINSEAENVWYIDPLDGTKNFATSTPIFGIMMARARNGVVEAGGSFLPVLGELAYAEKSKGCWVNEEEAKPSMETDWAMSYGICPVRPGTESYGLTNDALREITDGKGEWANGIGCPAAACVWLAAGRRDWFVSTGSKIWDYAASSIIMQEAGCVILNHKGEAWSLEDLEIFACAPGLETKLREFLAIRYPIA